MGWQNGLLILGFLMRSALAAGNCPNTHQLEGHTGEVRSPRYPQPFKARGCGAWTLPDDPSMPNPTLVIKITDLSIVYGNVAPMCTASLDIGGLQLCGFKSGDCFVFQGSFPSCENMEDSLEGCGRVSWIQSGEHFPPSIEYKGNGVNLGRRRFLLEYKYFACPARPSSPMKQWILILGILLGVSLIAFTTLVVIRCWEQRLYDKYSDRSGTPGSDVKRYDSTTTAAILMPTLTTAGMSGMRAEDEPIQHGDKWNAAQGLRSYGPPQRDSPGPPSEPLYSFCE